MMRNDSNGYQLVVSNSFRQSPAPLRLSHPQTPVISPTTSVSQTGMLQPPPLTPVVSVGPMPALSSVSTVGWMYPSDIQPQAHTTGLFPLQMQDNVYETAARLLFMVLLTTPLYSDSTEKITKHSPNIFFYSQSSGRKACHLFWDYLFAIRYIRS